MSGSVRRAVLASWERDGLIAHLLAPFGWIYALGAAMRNAGFDLGATRTVDLGRPTVSVGNLTVGGTGKTPVSAWVAAWFLARSLKPAILLRGYGDDEPKVHARLVPGALVAPDPSRARAAESARAAGAQAFVLDDGFQHRQARRDLDLVLLPAEERGSRRCLPAGPYRETRRSLRRAHAVIVTRKDAPRERAEAVLAEALRSAPGAVGVIMHLAPGPLRLAAGGDGARPDAEVPLDGLRGKRVLAVSAIGAPASFEAQLRSCGAVVEGAAYPDHHAFTAADVTALTRRAQGAELVVCTLKDAVKLDPLWPRQGRVLWYLSQSVTVERGAADLDALLGRLVTAVRH